jgi:MinD superfamily P-loop ATPase
MIISIASGKGGTGKTTVATNLALSLGNVQLLDCDVEEPDSHLFLDLKLEKVEDVCINMPVIDKEICDFCGDCAKFCQYNALAVVSSDVLFFPELCHGCGGCTLVCPKNAIKEEPRVIGVIEGGTTENSSGKKVSDISIKGNIQFFHGLLNVGEPMAIPVIKSLKQRIDGKRDVILDAPPGTSCPVIETIEDTDYCILVTEPTPFGLHDLKLAVDVVRGMQIPFGVIINRDGIGDERVERYCHKECILILMKIPQSEEIARLYSKGIPFVTQIPEWEEKFLNLYKYLKREVNQ